MRKLPLLFALLLLPEIAAAQGVASPPQVALNTLNGVTRPIPNATITVCAANASGIPCAPVLVNQVWANSALNVAFPGGNPFTSDANGNYQFFATAGQYTVTVTASGYAGYSSQVSLGCVPLATCNVGTLNATGGININGSPLASANLADVSGWTNYTPTVTAGSGTFTTVSATGRYFKIGKLVHVTAQVTITTVGSASGIVFVSLPFTSGSQDFYIGSGREVVASGLALVAQIGISATVMSVNSMNLSGGLYLWNGSPIAAGNVLAVSVFYESAS
jgi:hypothetical protein